MFTYSRFLFTIFILLIASCGFYTSLPMVKHEPVVDTEKPHTGVPVFSMWLYCASRALTGAVVGVHVGSFIEFFLKDDLDEAEYLVIKGILGGLGVIFGCLLEPT